MANSSVCGVEGGAKSLYLRLTKRLYNAVAQVSSLVNVSMLIMRTLALAIVSAAALALAQRNVTIANTDPDIKVRQELSERRVQLKGTPVRRRKHHKS